MARHLKLGGRVTMSPVPAALAVCQPGPSPRLALPPELDLLWGTCQRVSSFAGDRGSVSPARFGSTGSRGLPCLYSETPDLAGSGNTC